MKSKKSFLLLVILLFFVAGLRAQQWSGILSPDRAIDWSTAGVVGGIPSAAWTQCGPTVAPYSGTADIINKAIADCGTNQYVQLGAGTFRLSTGVTWGSSGKSRVALRGMGGDQTFLVFTGQDSCRGTRADVCMASADTNWNGGTSNSANWTGGYGKGATSITLSSVTNLKVGQPLILDQLDDSSDTGEVFVCADTKTSPPCSLEGNTNNGQRLNRNQTQIVTVTSCGSASSFGQVCNGNNVSISPGLYMPNWSSAKSPGAWWATTPIFYNGIEDLSLDHTGSSGAKGIEIFNCSNCWVSGVRSIDSGKAHVEMQESCHTTVQNNYFYKTQNSVSQSYGVEALNAADDLYINNIAQYVAAPWIANSACTGCVIAYNYSINDYYVGSAGYVMAATHQHAAGTAMLLYEGNIGASLYADNFHGTHNFVTTFRNYWIGNQPGCYDGSGLSACSSNQVAMDMRSYSRYYNIIGNVLGESGVHNGYESGSKPIYSIGLGNSNGSVTVPGDSLVAKTLMRWGNYDTVNGAVRWAGSEVPTAAPKYPNPIPASQSLPSSFFLSSKPNWWPAAKSWPLIGPDVTDGNIPNMGGHANTNPAQDCYLNVMRGPADGGGGVLSFNAGRCYTFSSAPSAPKNLRILN